tara:strand:+ start:845 stop:2017 length:1173 start_codon:yes stop_codon:yes gene_type:complete
VNHTTAIKLLKGIETELADIHRAKHYAQWRSEAVGRLDKALSETTPFKDYTDTWIFTGDGGGTIAKGRFAVWAIDQLVAKVSPEDILVGFDAELQQNRSTYAEISPVLGVQIDGECQLSEGMALVPAADAPLHWRGQFMGSRQPFPIDISSDTCFLCQSFEVTPAFELSNKNSGSAKGTSETRPDSAARNAIRLQVRLACLLASVGGVELPHSLFDPDRETLFVGGLGNRASRPVSAHPLVSFPVKGAEIKAIFDQLASFQESESLGRAIDRLGRSRMATNPVDRALDLGIAAEIALMHDHGTSNTEIAHKIGGRAAWLAGKDAVERATIFAEMKKLYQARSQAVHAGTLSQKSKVDLDAGDRLVTNTLLAILDGGSFPDWSTLVMGGDR